MLHLFNSLSQKKEVFTSIEAKKVSLYACGITPYDTTHLGHAFTYIFFDALVRYLDYLGYEVTYTQNVTDINDRDNDILKRAKEQNVTWKNLSEFWTQKFQQNMKTLNWVFPTNYLYASKQIEPMISVIQKILEHKSGYEVNGSVYLDITTVKNYGDLSKFSKSKMLTVAKEFDEDLQNSQKRHPLDITLWRSESKNDPPHIPAFESPWGKGRPGWHIECSAMAISSLGQQIDIHGGGIDLIYPHHESEIAQSESATGKHPFAKIWMHTGIVSINGQKMSKSLHNLILVDDLLKKYSPDAIRFVLLSHNYRHAWTYNENEFIEAVQTLKTFSDFLSQEKNLSEGKIKNKAILNALNDDMNIPFVFEILSDIIKTGRSGEDKNNVFSTMRILGFTGL